MSSGGDAKQEAKWSLMYWGGAGVGAFIYALWSAWDGWFSGHDKATFNQIMTPISLAIAAWLVWQGVKESRQIRDQAAKEQGTDAADVDQKTPDR